MAEKCNGPQSTKDIRPENVVYKTCGGWGPKYDFNAAAATTAAAAAATAAA